MKILELIKLYRYHRNINLLDKKYHIVTIKECIRCVQHRDVSSIERNLICSILKQLRTLNPYIVKDYSTAKITYDNYFKSDNHITSYEDLLSKINKNDVYVTKFTTEIVVKGPRFCEYYIAKNSCEKLPIVYKLSKENIQRNWINMHDPSGFANVYAIQESAFTNYRYSTEDEETNFDFCEIEIKTKKDAIETKQKEISRLYKQIDTLKKSII